jgi:hypothetical protein
MASMIDPIDIMGYSYVSKPDHRDGTRVKSQWNIPIKDEHASFALGIDNGWKSGQAAWSLHLNDERAAYLGRSAVDPGPVVPLFIAYFQISSICHGYPSDLKRSAREVPPNPVRGDWLAKGYLRPAVIRKIGRGLVCGL